VSSSTAAAPAGSEADELAAKARESKEGVKQGLRDTQAGIKETVYETKEQIKARVQVKTVGWCHLLWHHGMIVSLSVYLGAPPI
jgi:hypothetical protein